MLSLLETILAMFLMEKDCVARDDGADEDKSLMDDSNKRDRVNRGEFNKNTRFSREARATSALSCTCWKKMLSYFFVHKSAWLRVTEGQCDVKRYHQEQVMALPQAKEVYNFTCGTHAGSRKLGKLIYSSHNLEYVPLYFILIISFRCEEMGCVHLWRVCWRNTS